MATIYSYSSNSIYCTYSLSISRSGSNVTVTAQGTIYGNGSSSDSNNNLYAHVYYNVSPANTSGATTYVSSYGTSLGAGVLIVSKPLNKTSIPTSGKSFKASWTFTNNNSVNLNNCALFLSKSNSSPSAVGGEAYAFVGKKDSSLSGNKIRYYTQNLSVGAGYTACTAPTTVVTNKPIFAPGVPSGNSYTISWSGASGGSNNPISSYVVYWKIGAQPTLSDYGGYTIITDPSVTSHSYSALASAQRGQKLYFKVQARGSAGASWYSPISSASASVKYNSLPSAPTVQASKNIVKSDGENVIFNLSATDPDAQSLTFAYSLVDGGEKTEISSGDSIEVTQDSTFYFYAKDSLDEYGPSTEKTVLVNTKPTIEISVNGDGQNYNSELLTTQQNSQFYTKTSSEATVNKQDTIITWKIRYKDLSLYNQSSGWEEIDLLENSSTSFEYDLSSSSFFQNLNNIVYQIGAVCRDEIETSDVYWSNTNFVIAPLPEIGDFINDYGTQSVSRAITNHFYQKGSVLATKDTSVISINININNNASYSTLSDTINTYKTNGYFKFNILNTIPNTNYTLIFTINRVIGSVSKEFSIVSCGLPSVGNSVFSDINIFNQTEILKPYTGTGNLIISLYNFFQTLSYSSVVNDYDGTSLPSSCLQFKIVNGENSITISPTYSQDSSSSTLFFTIGKNFYKSLIEQNPLNLDLENSNTVGLQVIFTNVFGQSFVINKNDYLTMDFREPFINDTGFNIYIIRNNTMIQPMIPYVYEQDKIRLSFSWQSYNSQIASVETYIYRSSTTISNPSTITNWEKYQDNSNYLWHIDTSESTPQNLIRSGTATKEYSVGLINKSNFIYFKIVTNLNGKTKTYYYGQYKITQRHITIPTIQFQNLSYNDTQKKIVYNHSNYDCGGGLTPNNSQDTSIGITKIEIGIQYSSDFNSDTNIKYINTDGTSSDTFVALITKTAQADIRAEQTATTTYENNFNLSDWLYYNIRFVIKTTTAANEKISFGEEHTIYNSAPSVSYRKNQISINVRPESIQNTEISSTGAVIIQGASNKEYVYIISANNTIKIKMDDGSIDGVIIDGGSW